MNELYFSHYREFAWRIDDIATAFPDARADGVEDSFCSALLVFEDGKPLSAQHAPHADIFAYGNGAFSHWDDYILFSTPGNECPLTNGKVYEVGFASGPRVPIKENEAKRRGRTPEELSDYIGRLRAERVGARRPVISDVWALHPRGDFFLSRGGDKIPPPRHANLTLTNKCNLRCEICGSQKNLDLTKTQRHHMKLETFRGIAETVFPFMAEVELNSQGDPLLYPHIQEVLRALQKHQCLFRIQHNGTLLSDEIIDLLEAQHGTLSLSLDAVGPALDEVRRGAKWAHARIGLEKLLATRDKKRMSVWMYPTITARTAPHMFDTVKWAHEHEVDYVLFHDYCAVEGSTECAADRDEKQRQIDKIRTFLDREDSLLRVHDNDEAVFTSRTPLVKKEMPSALKAQFYASYNSPLEADHPQANQTKICPVPWQSLDINIDGYVSPCCRSQHYPFGRIDSLEAFADLWFGDNYRKLRESLLRKNTGGLPLPPCKGCLQASAPKGSRHMKPIIYRNNRTENPAGFVFDKPRAGLALLFRERAGTPAFAGRMPLGLDPSHYELYEDDTLLGPVSSYNEVLEQGGGRYAFAERDNICYFSASDNGEPLLNGRTYELRRKKG